MPSGVTLYIYIYIFNVKNSISSFPNEFRRGIQFIEYQMRYENDFPIVSFNELIKEHLVVQKIAPA